MRIGLVDVDSHNFPNLCLMKLSAYHKAKGDEVEFAVPLLPYDRIYMARVFDDTYTHDDLTAYQCTDVRRGGTGYGLDNTLPDEIEHIMPDYGLYGITDTAYGFLTRGCPRHCPFCIVGNKEGLVSRKVADLSEFWNGQKNIILCDPNLLACKDRMNLLKQLADSKATVEINQGFDARLLDDEVIDAMNEIKLNMVHFAWDNPKDKVVPQKLLQFAKKSKLKSDSAKTVYCLTNYWSTHEEDLYRVEWLKSNGFLPYIMIFNKEKAPLITRQLQRYVNNRFIFRSAKDFDDYLQNRGNRI